jgi:hypothetical protein
MFIDIFLLRLLQTAKDIALELMHDGELLLLAFALIDSTRTYRDQSDLNLHWHPDQLCSSSQDQYKLEALFPRLICSLLVVGKGRNFPCHQVMAGLCPYPLTK